MTVNHVQLLRTVVHGCYTRLFTVVLRSYRSLFASRLMSLCLDKICLLLKNEECNVLYLHKHVKYLALNMLWSSEVHLSKVENYLCAINLKPLQWRIQSFFRADRYIDPAHEDELTMTGAEWNIFQTLCSQMR